RGQDIGYFADPEIQTMFTIATIQPYKDYPDTAENRKKGFIERLGTRILNRRLATLARKADADFISAGAAYEFSQDSADIMGISVSSRPENWKKAVAVIDQELRKALKYGFTEAELKEQLANSKKALEVAVQTSDTRRTGALASGILGAFAAENVYSTPAATLARYNSYADDITVEQVWDEFKKQWKGVDKPLLYLQTSEILEEPEQEILQAYQDSQAVEVQADKVKDLGKFAYTDFGTPGKVVNETHIDDVDADLIVFENNVRLNFKKTDFEKDTIRISVKVGDGSLSMPRKDGALSILASNMMSAGGLKAHSVDDLQKLMAGKAVGAGFGIGTKTFSISGSTVPSNLDDEFNLLMAMLIAPGYRDEAVARYHKYIESWYPTLDSTPGGVASRDVPRLVRSGDLRYGIPNEDELLSADPQEVKTWINSQLKDGPIEITVVGDIDKDVIIKQVARTFGTLDKRKTAHGEYPAMTKLKFPEKRRKIVTLNHSGDQNRALVQVFWKAPDGSDRLRNRRLNVLRRVFANRLTDVIREEEGLAYSPSAGVTGSHIFKGYGYMSASAGLKPGKAALMLVKLEQIATDLSRGNITEDEYTRAIKPILENLNNSLENNGYWMSILSDAQSDKRGLESFRTRDTQYKSMKLEDIKPLAAEIFKRENAYRVQILPKK
ncbi:MAG TPA: insulinase family protein, partial [Hellea balneolensis]|nr:insulinase family protein [Hellea balneolensis]